MTFLVVLIGWVFSLCLHEFSHALVAYYGGDITVKDKGYLTFNPLKYTHPVYSLLLPLVFLMMGGIGLPGGAVYIERWRLRSKQWETAVSLAGPFSNALLALILGLILQGMPISSSGIWPGLAFLAFLLFTSLRVLATPVPVLDLEGSVDPGSSDYLVQGIEGAEPLDPLSAALMRMIVGAAAMWVGVLAFGRLHEIRKATKDGRGVGLTFSGAITGPFLGVWLSMVAVSLALTGVAQTLMSLMPVMVIPVVWLLYKQGTGWRGIAGACIAIVGVAMLFIV